MDKCKKTGTIMQFLLFSLVTMSEVGLADYAAIKYKFIFGDNVADLLL